MKAHASAASPPVSAALFLVLALCLCSPLAGCHSGESKPSQAAPTAPSPGLFADVTAAAGITFRHTNGEQVRYLFLQSMGGGCAMLDYDQDGYPDILLLSCGNWEAPQGAATPNLALYHNNRDGTFTDVTPGSGLDVPLGYAQALAVGDYDNDGYPDVFAAGYGGCHLFHNTGAHTNQTARPLRQAPGQGKGGSPSSHDALHPTPLFTEETQHAGLSDTDQGPRWCSGAVWGDYDNDGKLDLYLCHYARWTPETDIRCPRPDGTPGYCVPTVYTGDTGRLFHNEGGGRFRDVTKAAGLDKVAGRGLAAAWLDYDQDGRQDLYIANDLDPNRLLHNSGKGVFTDVAIETGTAMGRDGSAMSGMGIALGDYDHSGWESLFVCNLHGEGFSLFQNTGKGLFRYASSYAGLYGPTRTLSGWGAAFLDLDRDGWSDLVTANGSVHEQMVQDLPGITYREPKGVYRNTGKGAFDDISLQSGAMTLPRAARGLAVGDYDNDGRLDVLCVNRNERADLFRNVSPDRNHWINLLLAGTKSNRDGAGAKVWVTAGGQRQFAECHLGSSYASSSERRLFFGLGAAAKIAVLEIRWPGGQRDIYRDIPTDDFLVVTEGRGYEHDKRVRLSGAR